MKHVLVLFFLLGTIAYGQQTAEDVTLRYQDGKLYLLHTAEAGNTLFGMQSVYGVSVEQIVKANPGSEKGLKVGQTYLIPQGATSIKAQNGSTLVKHTVVKGETLYALCKKYGSDINEVNTINPEAASGLKLGQVLYFPLTNNNVNPPIIKNEPVKETTKTVVQFSDSIVNYEVKKGETMYTISKRYMVSVAELQKFNNLKSTNLSPGTMLKIPIKKEKIDQVPIREIEDVKEQPIDKELLFSKKSTYNIVVLLPFGLDKSLGAGLKNLSTEYYMGMMLAVDSLEKEGIKATVSVIDFPIDSIEVIQALKKTELKTADLIIGPLIPQAADQVAQFCKSNKIRMVCPSSVNSSVLKDNPFVYCAVASEITQQHILAKYTLEKFKGAQIVLVNLDPKKDAEIYQAYRSHYLELAAKSGGPKLIEVKMADFGAMIRKNANTVFVVPSTNQANVVKFMLALHKLRAKAGDGSISVLGTKDWAGFDELTGYYKNTYDVQWCTASDLNYADQKTEDLLRTYRIRYKSDMNKVAVQGYDIMRYFVPYLLNDKENKAGLIQNSFDMNQVAPNAGFENKECFVVGHEEYKLVRKGIYHE